MAMDSLMYLVISLAIFAGLFIFINSYNRGSAFYEDFYVKEIVNLINNAGPGMEFKLDVTKLASIAFKNGKPVKEIIDVDNVLNKVVVSSRIGAGTSFGFFNDVDIVYLPVENPSGNIGTTQFIFKIVEKQK